MKRIGIIGATGMIGQPVTNAFIEAGYDVKLFVRNIEKARQYFSNSVQYLQGDLRDPLAVKRFISELEYLYLNLSVAQHSEKDDFQPERDGMDNIIAALKDSQVRRIGYLSSLVHWYEGQNGFHWWVFELKRAALNKIRSSAIPHAIFYPSTFMENFDQGAYRRGNIIAISGESRFKMFLIAGKDYGRQVVKSFEIENGYQEFVVQGQEGYTADEAAALFKQFSGNKKLKIVKVPFGFLKLAALFSNTFRYGAKMIEALNNYPEKFEAEETWNILGKPQTKLKDYILHENKAGS